MSCAYMHMHISKQRRYVLRRRLTHAHATMRARSACERWSLVAHLCCFECHGLACKRRAAPVGES